MQEHFLGIDIPWTTNGPDDIPAVQYYVMGDVDDARAPGNEWRTADDWPLPAAPVRLYLQPDGTLEEACPTSAGSLQQYRYDPVDPTPTVCGNNLLIDNGPCDQRAVESRSDVLVFSTPTLREPLEISGQVFAHLFVDIDRPVLAQGTLALSGYSSTMPN